MTAVDVLLATYNGASHLLSLLRSLEAQTKQDFRLIIRDDGSNDGTLDVLEQWTATTSLDCLMLRDEDTGLGAKGNFARLLEASDRPYFMCCDQDDVWRPEKIERSFHALRAAEAQLGADTPLLAHCDLEVVGADLGVIAPSFWDQQGLGFVEVPQGPTGDQPRKTLLIRNVVTGCALIGNAALRERALPIPRECAMHDWWLALVAAYLGGVLAIEEPLIQYRQHGMNSLGAKDWSAGGVLKRAVSGPNAAFERTRSWVHLAQLQAAEIEARFASDLTSHELEVVREFARLHEAPFRQRKTFMRRHGITAQSRFHSLVTWLVL